MERKAFNFFKSYYDVGKELNDIDRLAFYDALLLEQFTGIKTDLSGMAKFAYLSQKHSIDSQISGFNQRLKRGDTTLEPLSTLPPAIGVDIGGSVGANLQEKEKEKEKVQYVLPQNSKKIKPKKISFEDCELYDKNKFLETFNTWSREKMKHYYDAALRYSIEGNKYVSWQLAIQTWERKDAGKGIVYAPIESEMTQYEINKQKERDFYARL